MVFCEFELDSTLKILSRFIIDDLAKIIVKFLAFENGNVNVNLDKIIVEDLNKLFNVPVKLYYQNGKVIKQFDLNLNKETVITYPFCLQFGNDRWDSKRYTWKRCEISIAYMNIALYWGTVHVSEITQTLRISVEKTAPSTRYSYEDEYGLFCVFEKDIKFCVIQ